MTKHLTATILLMLWIAPTTLGQENSGNVTTSTSVDETLTTECFRNVDRRDVLRSLRGEESSPEAWWQSGYVEHGDGWVRYEDLIDQTKTNAFHKKRQKIIGHGESRHLQLARLSLRNKQIDRYRAHMLAAARNVPNLLDRKTVQQMGFRRINGAWFTPEEVYALFKKYTDYRQSFQLFGKDILAIREGLVENSRDRERAEFELSQIASPAAIDAIYHILMTGDARCQRAATRSLAGINCARSTLLLAECGLFSPFESARLSALEALRTRPKEGFVPQLLDLLVKVHTDSIASGNFFNGFAFTTRAVLESADKLQVHTSSLKLDLEASWVSDPVAWSPGVPHRLISDPDFRNSGLLLVPKGYHRIMNSFAVRDWQLRNEKQTTEARIAAQQINRRVSAVLSAVSDEHSEDPEFWWAWWNKYSDIEAPVKEVVEVERHVERQSMEVTVSPSCFVAGTPVITEVGPRSIETLQIGDRVLSQDPDTGELRFRVVQQTTIRPPRVTRTINFDSESVQCTGGHNFWKAGTGWVKARDLGVGDRIRTPTGTEAVAAVAKGDPEKTYNLVVEGFHTYFVGESKLLVQDVLPITPTDNVLPGFSKFELGEDTPKSDRSE